MDDFDRLRSHFERSQMVIPASIPATQTAKPIVNRLRPAPEKIVVRVGADLRMRLEDIPEDVRASIERRLTWKNPIWGPMQRRGKIRPGATPTLTGYFISGDEMIVSRGWVSTLVRTIQAARIQVELEDHTCKGALDSDYLRFTGELYAYQKAAVAECTARRFGIITGATGCGKKVIALYLAARFQSPCLVIVRWKWQLYHWAAVAERFIDRAADVVGIVGDGKSQIDRPLIIGTDKSLYKLTDKLAARIGFMVVDACDVVQINAFFKIVRQLPSSRMLGLASSQTRQDGLSQLMCAYIGPVLHQINIANVQAELRATPPVLVIRKTAFSWEFKDDYGAMVSAAGDDEDRNRMIVADIIAETADPKRKALVICDRKTHMETLQKALADNYREAVCVRSEMLAPALEGAMRRFNGGKLQVLMVASRSIHRVDTSVVDRLFIASPIGHPEFVAQAVARVRLDHEDDPALIIDYVDGGHIAGLFQKRRTVYKSFNIKEVLHGGQ